MYIHNPAFCGRSQGEGVWIARLVDERLYRVNDTLPLDTKLELVEVRLPLARLYSG